MEILVIGVGGTIGAISRFWLSTTIYGILGRDFPWGTLVVNVVGSLLIGFLYAVLMEKVAVISVELRAFLIFGVLGAFTTFSTFSLETLLLLEQGDIGKALLNAFMSVFLCLFAAWCGLLLGRVEYSLLH